MDAANTVTALQAELAREIIRLAHDEGWTAGTRVHEQKLARRLGVSRTPVHGALLALTARGILQFNSRQGFTVVTPINSLVETAASIPSSGADELYRTLMTKRASGLLPQDVSEAELAERFNAPRGVVRKALQRLSADGLIHRLRGHGWRFVEMLGAAEAIAEAYTFRIVIECAALRQPSYKIDIAKLNQLRRAHEDLLEALVTGVTHEQWFTTSATFHETLISWAGNRFFLQAMRQQNHLRRMHEYADYASTLPSRIEQAIREHLEILDALANKEMELAEALMRRHLILASHEF